MTDTTRRTLPIATPRQVRDHTLGLIRQHRGLLGLVVGLQGLAALAALVTPWLMGRLLDDLTRWCSTKRRRCSTLEPPGISSAH